MKYQTMKKLYRIFLIPMKGIDPNLITSSAFPNCQLTPKIGTLLQYE